MNEFRILATSFQVILLVFSCFFNKVQSQDEATNYYSRGYNYLSVDKRKAIELLSKSIELNPSYSNAYFHRGITYFKLNNFDSALLDFTHAYNLNSNLSVILLYQGFCYRNKGDYEAALELFSRYITLHPTDTTAYAYILKGKMKYELGDFDGAAAEYDMASKLKPFEEKYNYYKYLAYKDGGLYRLALKCINNLIHVNPGFYGYYFYKGQLFHDMGHYDSAIFMYNTAIIKNYRNPDSYFYRARTYQSQGKLKKALENYNKAIGFNASDGAYYSGRGDCKDLLEDKDGACKDWTKAGELGYYEDFERVKKVCK